MKIGDYVRNKYGIAKIINIENNNGIDILVFDKSICFLVNKKTGEIKRLLNKLPITNNIDINKIKSSPNIIDLIEVGDYVNGHRVYNKARIDTDDYGNDFKEVGIESDRYLYHWVKEKDIKSIVTKEQFSSMEYNVSNNEKI